MSSPTPSDEVPAIPGCDTIIDLAVLKGDALEAKVLKLIQVLFPEWAEGVEKINIERVSGALTNAVFFINAVNKPRLLLRVYGNGVDQIVDRENELAWLARLSSLNIGPRLLAVFGNGRFEQYFPSTTLTHDDMCTPETSKRIASCLREIHDIVTVYPFDPTKDHLEIWANIDKWYNVVMSLLPNLMNKSDGWAKVLKVYNLERVSYEIQELKKILGKVHSPVVFGHNDTQYGNVLQLEDTNELLIVDYEYSGYNPRGYDLSNHFCEWAYDYHSDQPAAMDMNKYPTYEEQIRFLKAYLETPSKFNNPDINSSVTPESLQKEADMWLTAGHLAWGLWGLIQANQSEIEFDYFLYSIQRLNAFREGFAKWSS